MGETSVLIPLATGLAAIAGAWFTYLLALRRASGRVSTTDADRLWKQNEKLIEALTHDNQSLRNRIDSLVEQNDILRQRCYTLEQRQQQSELAESECLERADRLLRKIAELERRINETSPPTERVVIEGAHLEATGPEPAEPKEGA